jgi:hypothetical protein
MRIFKRIIDKNSFKKYRFKQKNDPNIYIKMENEF